MWARAFVLRWRKNDPSWMSPCQADRLTGLHGRGVGGRAGRPSASPVVGSYSHMVLGVGVQVSDSGTGVQPCCPHSVSSGFFVPSFPVADLKGAGQEYPRVSSQVQDLRAPLALALPIYSVPLLLTLVLGTQSWVSEAGRYIMSSKRARTSWCESLLPPQCPAGSW